MDGEAGPISPQILLAGSHPFYVAVEQDQQRVGVGSEEGVREWETLSLALWSSRELAVERGTLELKLSSFQQALYGRNVFAIGMCGAVGVRNGPLSPRRRPARQEPPRRSR